MRRETLNLALKNIISDLEASGLPTMIKEAIEKSRESSKDSGIVSFKVFQSYMVAVSRYGDVERRVLAILDLDDLLDPTFWEKMQDIPDVAMLYSVYRPLNAATGIVPRILALISQDYVEDLRGKSEELPANLRGKEVVTAILAEEDGVFSSPDRIVFAIKSISDLYAVHAELEGHSHDDLILLACDSGSDKSFDFLGAAKIVAALKETLIFVWDSIVFHRHGQARATVDVLARTLPLLEKIDEMERAQTIVPELAEQLRRKALGACAKFVEAGVIIPEMTQEATQSPRLLMTPERRLLAGPALEDKKVATAELSGSPIVDSDTDAEIDILRELNDLKQRVAKAERGPAARRSPAKRTKPPSKRS